MEDSTKFIIESSLLVVKKVTLIKMEGFRESFRRIKRGSLRRSFRQKSTNAVEPQTTLRRLNSAPCFIENNVKLNSTESSIANNITKLQAICIELCAIKKKFNKSFGFVRNNNLFTSFRRKRTSMFGIVFRIGSNFYLFV